MIEYEIVDMFTDRPFDGCALGVVPDAHGLSGADMLAVAGEIGLTETAFVMPPESPGATYRVRVFTPRAESPFGGHSAVGTATALVRRGDVPAGRLVQECGGRLLALSASGESATLSVEGDPLPDPGADWGGLLAACGLAEEDRAGTARADGFGPVFHFLPVRPDAVSRAAMDPASPVWDACRDAVVLAWDAVTRTAHARVFAPGYGMPEDPACASAALGLGAWLAGTGLISGPDGRYAYHLVQGAELGRPAALSCTVTLRDGRAAAATVTGRVTATAHGRMRVPRARAAVVSGRATA
ncbi:PhzF family phenazine biosynthesis protein [Streptomyces sp. NPDC006923]|uniref:PhzF family phenazine biosynthesis protein n=1 Tax=Streptomyces sp. NPDC006923 TaxID=3155355 RepID=UPI0033C2ADC1